MESSKESSAKDKVEPPKSSATVPLGTAVRFVVVPPTGFTCQKLLIGLVNLLIFLLFIFLSLVFLFSGGGGGGDGRSSSTSKNSSSSSSNPTEDLVGGLDGNISVFLLLFLYFFSGAYGALGESERCTWFYFAFTVPLAILLIVCSLCSLHRLTTLNSSTASPPRVLGHLIFILLTLLWIVTVGVFARNLHRLKRSLSRSAACKVLAEKRTSCTV
ncbi:hypothetical protein TYRP_000773 [Tyrophagus putrescentiae]|nr:hypothetical protein TYRP_000773 [Tyrophagus putrescentiae]